ARLQAVQPQQPSGAPERWCRVSAGQVVLAQESRRRKLKDYLVGGIRFRRRGGSNRRAKNPGEIHSLQSPKSNRLREGIRAGEKYQFSARLAKPSVSSSKGRCSVSIPRILV